MHCVDGNTKAFEAEVMQWYSQRFAASVQKKEVDLDTPEIRMTPMSVVRNVRADLERDLAAVNNRNINGQKMPLCCHCHLPLGEHAYQANNGALMHGECMADLLLKDEQEQAEASKQQAAKSKAQNRVDYDLGWKVERAPRNMGLVEKLTGKLLGEGICCLKLNESSNTVSVAPAVDSATSINLEYLSLALQIRFREGTEPLFSLDPVDPEDPNSMQAKRFEPEWLAGTSAGEVLFQADYHLKELSMGEYNQPIVGMKSATEFSHEEGYNKDWAAREWFVVKKAAVHQSNSNTLIPFVKMGCEAREQIVGANGLEDVKRTKPDHPLVKYAEVFTHNFDLIAERKSVVYHLRELAKASVMAKFLMEANVNMEKSWFELVAKPRRTCCLEVPQLWNNHIRKEIQVKDGKVVADGTEVEMDTVDSTTSTYGGVQFGLDRFSLAHSRAGAPMARAASLSSTMMQTPGVRAGISATMRAPLSASLGARAGISATSLAPSVFPSTFRAAPGALRTARAGISAMSLAPSALPSAFRAAPGGLRDARGVDLNLDQFSLSQISSTKVNDGAPNVDACVTFGNAFWSSIDTDSESLFKDKDKSLLKAIFHPCLSDRRDEGDRFVPPDASMKYVENLRNLLKEEEAVRQARRSHFFSDKFVVDNAGPMFPSSWSSSFKVVHNQAMKQTRALCIRPEYAAEVDTLRCALKSAEPIFSKSVDDGPRFRIYKVGRLEIRTIQEINGEEEVGAVFSVSQQ